jgi:hypothetical protein
MIHSGRASNNLGHHIIADWIFSAGPELWLSFTKSS